MPDHSPFFGSIPGFPLLVERYAYIPGIRTIAGRGTIDLRIVKDDPTDTPILRALRQGDPLPEFADPRADLPDPPTLPDDWPPEGWPPGWHTSVIPINDTLAAVVQWFDFWLQVLRADVPLRIEQAGDWSYHVRDAWRLVRHLNTKGVTSIPDHDDRERHSAPEAIRALRNLRERIIAAMPPTPATTTVGKADSRARFDNVRKLVSELGKEASQKQVMSEYRKRFRKGMRTVTLQAILDELRELEEYTTPRKQRRTRNK
jgi:hypothetical protein